MRTTINVTTFGDLLVRAANKWPDNDALIFPDHHHTYAELLAASEKRAASFIGLGVKPGDHVGILMANCPEYIECLMGAQLIGALAVPMNARYKPPELAYVAENADIKVIITHDRISEYANFARLLGDAFEEKSPAHLQHMVMLGEPAPGLMTEQAFIEAGTTVAQELIETWRGQVALRDPAIMMYTSGTTANPKGCPLSHEVLVRNGMNMNSSRYFLNETDRFWAPLPMFHMASILPLLCCMDAGAALLSMTHVEAGQALKMMEQEKATIAFPSFPTITTDLINHPDFKTRDLSRIRRINNVAPQDQLDLFQRAFPQAVQTGAYGLTEAGGVIAFNHPDEPLEVRLRTCGKPMPGLQARIIDPETLEPLPFGEKGEILLKGYSVFDGYYKAPEKNSEAFLDGWFRTGDLALIDKDGYIEFHGRIKDMLKVGGENVAALEIESLLSTHPAINMAQVIGVPDPRLSEVACAYIELKSNQVADEQEIIAYCKDKIASYKVPRYVRFVQEWPMSATKIQKFVLRDWFDRESDTH
ncbi:MAG: class I adenylate-forming enzyme family protein [Proteobacteria bacterium]|nr:class I adenylate-forming enzyme family protein [Pseudomonadota bacterium]